MGKLTELEADQNQFAAKAESRRLVLVAGKFSLGDFLDDNTYAHDPRTQFLNWGFMDDLAWDYAADTRGYTWGFVLMLELDAISIRWAEAMEPAQANQLDMDTDLAHARGDNLEISTRYRLAEKPGQARLLSYVNHAHMGSYAEALSDSALGPDITKTREYRIKYGFGLNLEQELASGLGAFARLGWNDGATETWAFTEVDRVISFGASLRGERWGRAADTIGLGVASSWLAKSHADYLAAGGAGFMIGDGALNYAPEEVLDAYYLWRVREDLGVTPDLQFVEHPGFNADRGPAWIVSARLHYEI